MHSTSAVTFLLSKISVTRELIARAKAWLIQNPAGDTGNLVETWLRQQSLSEYREIDGQALNIEEYFLTELGKSYGARLAFYQAIAELIGDGLILSASQQQRWRPGVIHSHQGYRGGLDFKGFGCSYPASIEPSPLGDNVVIDVDIFLEGVDCKNLHPGIHEAIEQSLMCFRRGLYMPATAMLAAAAEATWCECADRSGKESIEPQTRGDGRRSSRRNREDRCRDDEGPGTWQCQAPSPKGGVQHLATERRRDLDDDAPRPPKRPPLGEGEEFHRRSQRYRSLADGRSHAPEDTGLFGWCVSWYAEGSQGSTVPLGRRPNPPVANRVRNSG